MSETTDETKPGGKRSAKAVTLGDLQLAIMRLLWAHGEAAVSEVHAELYAERGLAPTTIATMLVKLERRGVVDHRLEGRKYIYRPTVTEDQVKRSMVNQLTERLFGGDVDALVSHLISEHDLPPEDLAELRRRIAERETEEDER